eukprot:CAMPEP_0116059096 /NCGR_PEP_ID=MMETSP0322-20121206/5594_1 /TAXON_ID=163516 /ORGANISM="Leptocylindrus danicus var. apora, Strain B651" /LENGTH=158 /DNA_ID=CAMNT_0003543415 /DNA_START=40 /DNA_END=516 /DNA_ORIENTATION=-
MEEETTDSFLRCSSSSSTMSLLNRVLASHQPLHQMSSPQYIDAQREKILRALDFLFSSGKMQVTFESALEILDMTLSSSDVGLSSSPKGLLGSSTSPLRIVRANPSNRVAYVVQSSSGVSGEEYVCFQSYCSCRDFYNQLTNKLKVEDAVVSLHLPSS